MASFTLTMQTYIDQLRLSRFLVQPECEKLVTLRHGFYLIQAQIVRCLKVLSYHCICFSLIINIIYYIFLYCRSIELIKELNWNTTPQNVDQKWNRRRFLRPDLTGKFKFEGTSIGTCCRLFLDLTTRTCGWSTVWKAVGFSLIPSLALPKTLKVTYMYSYLTFGNPAFQHSKSSAKVKLVSLLFIQKGEYFLADF